MIRRSHFVSRCGNIEWTQWMIPVLGKDRVLLRRKKIMRGKREKYLTRWTLLHTKWGDISLHCIEASDPQDPHDHPSGFFSIVLKGGYEERRYKIARDCACGSKSLTEISRLAYPPFSVNRVRVGDIHRISRLLDGPSWQLLFIGPDQVPWGFYEVDGHWVPSTRYKEPSISRYAVIEHEFWDKV